MKRIPPFKLVPEPLDEEAAKTKGFEWADDEVGKRHRIGGEPDMLQTDEWPVCPECGDKMLFYGQLDSINDDFCIADCGLIYTFVCLDCIEVKSIIQSS